MAMNGGDFATHLPDAVFRTLSYKADERRAAETWLNEHEKHPGFVVSLLNLVNNEQAAPHVRQATAIYLKNHVKNAWEDVRDADRLQVKQMLVSIMLAVPLPVRRQLSAVMASVAEYEYPEHWKELLPELTQRLSQCALTENVPIHWPSLQGILETIYPIFERYSGKYAETQIAKEIIYSLKIIQKPLLEVLNVVCRTIAGEIPTAALDANSRKAVELVLDNADLLCKIFYCLSWHVVSEFFEDHLQDFMGNFQGLLTYENQVITADAGDDEPTSIDKLHTSVLEIVNLYCSKHEEEFAPYLQKFVEDAWQLLTRCKGVARFDQVVTSGIKFLTTVALSTSYKLFSSPGTLSLVCKSIILPNIEIRDEDIELFEDNPVEYIRRDLEGSDAETRRRGAIELVRGLCKHFEEQVAAIFGSYMGAIVDPNADWRQKDLTLHLASALLYKSGNQAMGCVEVSNFFNISEFYQNTILPILSAASNQDLLKSAPILITDALKFTILFRIYIPKHAIVIILRHCEKFLTADNVIIRTYAASCVEKLLFVKEQTPEPNRVIENKRLSHSDFLEILPSLVRTVLGVLEREQTENEYVMRLFVRLCVRADKEIKPYAEQALATLVKLAGKIVKNPANPIFNHYLFECFALLIKLVASPETIASIEGKLIAPFQEILQLDIAEFVPYVFQLFSQMMAHNGTTLNPTYANMVPLLLQPDIWNRRDYVPGAILFLETYVRKNSQGVVAANQLDGILAVFQKLIASKAADHLGTQLLCTCIVSYRQPNAAPGTDPLIGRMETILRVLMTRLQVARTQKYTFNLLYVLSMIVIKYDVDTLKKNLDVQQPNLLHMLLAQVWLKTVLSIERAKERRVYAVAMTDLACATDLCISEPYQSIWVDMISVAIALVENVVVEVATEEHTEPEEELSAEFQDGFSAGHAKLHYGVDLELRIPLTNTNAKAHLVDRLCAFTAKHPGRFSSLIANNLKPEPQGILSRYLNEAGRTLS